MAAAAATSVRGCGPASASSVGLSPRRAVQRSSFLPPLPRRASSARALRAAVADAPHRGLELRREARDEAGLLEAVIGGDGGDEVEEAVGEERVEGWMRESIAEIVRHVGEAPFLVHLFSDGREGVTVRREPASAEAWPDVRRRWGPGGQRRPDGIILVEQVAAAAVEDGAEAARQVWGLVVQARGMECAACYVLDTCRVRSPAGFCTHFCLARAQCFGEPLELQLRNAWLNRLSGHHRR
ncbi:uncharacterized protein LOC119286737 [Triticum dicoccoides]|uniref:uncharacterized protein LOC119286737 n=1 Tax=Triticum dicoccoides TaxID=85692 RepID=UPI0018902EBF|nr:uncharacterized protein LOC119286737 [Triticum dicoccoides]